MPPSSCVGFRAYTTVLPTLAGASGRPDNVGRTVVYERKPTQLDGGIYIWRGRFPTIRLYRWPDLPPDPEQPDMVTRPNEDACTLAHERGHFISDRDGSRSQPAYTKLRKGDPLTAGEKVLIIEEERRAWTHGRDVLKALGCNSWDVFTTTRDEALRGYEDGLAVHPTA